MAQIPARTIPNAVVPRLFAAFNARQTKPEGVTDAAHLLAQIDEWIRSVVIDYEARQAVLNERERIAAARLAAANQASADLVIS